MSNQKTIKEGFELEGPTLWSRSHSGVRFYPAEADTGIVLRRVDRKKPARFPLSVRKAKIEDHRVILESSGARLCFVEHMLAALWGMGIDNVRVDVDGSELPFFDGSALEYVRGICRAGIVELDSPRPVLRFRGSFFVISKGRIIYVNPAQRLGISYLFNHKGLGFQRFKDVETVFAKNIAPARTFAVGDYPEFDFPFSIRERNNVSFPYPPRFPNEMLRHKVLDMIGDLALLGIRPLAHIWAWGTGHGETHNAIKLLLKEEK